MGKIAKTETKIAPEKKKKESKKTKDIANVNNLPVSINPQELLLKAMDKDLDIDKFERLVNMAREFEEREAEKLYYQALSNFQAMCPIIEKKKVVKNNNGTERYRYAPIEDIVKQVQDLLKQFGLSYTIQTEQTESTLTGKCITHHIAGHSKTTEVTVPIDSGNFMNKVQYVGSAITYAKRYAFCDAFGIMTGIDDDDGNSINVEPVKKQPETDTVKTQLKAEYDSIMKLINGKVRVTESDKIKYRKQVNDNVDNLVELKRIHSEVAGYKQPQAETKLTNEQIEQKVKNILSTKDKNGNRIFDRDACMSNLDTVRNLLRTSQAGAIKYIKDLEDEIKKAGGKI